MSSPPKITFPLPDLELILVEKGQVTLGRDKTNRSLDIAAFYMAKFPVTQGLYEAVMEKESLSRFKGTSRPLETISWFDARKFIALLNAMPPVRETIAQQFPKKDHNSIAFRLPSEAEWEFAAKGGIYSSGYEYAGSDDLKQVAWYKENSGKETKPIGLLSPNELGIYDMSGNIWEWCEDDYHDEKELGSRDRSNDGTAWVDGLNSEERATGRVVRGGSYFIYPIYYHSAYRFRNHPDDANRDIGFRLVIGFLV